MNKVKIYGSQRSRASRVTWCCRELGLAYEQIELTPEERKAPAYLAINPNGKVPALVDGDVKMFKSMAINLYLAKKFGTGELYPVTAADEALALQWTLWGVAEVEPLAMPSLLVAFGYSTDKAGAAEAAEKLKSVLMVLDDALKGREWILGKTFSIADLNVAGAVGLAKFGGIDISYAQNVSAWLERCNARSARN